MTKKHINDSHDFKKNRPLSPHLSIYKLQLTSGLSILHRITGAYLYFGMITLSWAIFALVYFPNTLEDLSYCIYSNFIATFVFKIMLLSWTFALFYHLLNGIRHLFWDIGKGFSLEKTYSSGKLVIASAIILTSICWIIALNNSEKSVIIEENVIELGN